MNYKNLKLYLIFLVSYSGSSLNSMQKKPALHFSHSNFINWSENLSHETLEHSWGTWNDFYRNKINPKIDREVFNKSLTHGNYQILSIEEFLALNVENQRLNRYKNAKTAEEAYPEHDRPRGIKDIESVNYFINTQGCVSPIVVAKVTDNVGSKRYIKLDGVHRLIAASIRKSPIKVFFIDLDL